MGCRPRHLCAAPCGSLFSSESGRRFFSLRVTNRVKSAFGFCFVSVACPSGSQPALACSLPHHRDPNVVHGLPVLPPHLFNLSIQNPVSESQTCFWPLASADSTCDKSADVVLLLQIVDLLVDISEDLVVLDMCRR